MSLGIVYSLRAMTFIWQLFSLILQVDVGEGNPKNVLRRSTLGHHSLWRGLCAYLTIYSFSIFVNPHMRICLGELEAERN